MNYSVHIPNNGELTVALDDPVRVVASLGVEVLERKVRLNWLGRNAFVAVKHPQYIWYPVRILAPEIDYIDSYTASYLQELGSDFRISKGPMPELSINVASGALSYTAVVDRAIFLTIMHLYFAAVAFEERSSVDRL